MQEWDKYREVKIKRGDLIDRLKGHSQSDWVKAIEKLGVEVCFAGGSHMAAYKENCPKEDKRCCIVTIHDHLHPQIQRDIFKKVLSYGLESGKYGEDAIWKALKIKI